MRILVVSNLYPPFYIGGYELGCKDVIERLAARGHELRVLTSTHGVKAPESDGKVYRWLEADMDWEPQPVAKHAVRLLRKEVRNQGAFKRLLKVFRPDLIYIWNLTHISISLALWAERLGLPVVYFVSDKWLSRWETDPWYQLWSSKFRRGSVQAGAKALATVLKSVGIIFSGSLSLTHAQFVSDFLRRDTLQAGKPVAEAEIIHWGVDTDRFKYKELSASASRLLYVGQVASHKGVHTAVEALKILVERAPCKAPTLTIVGGPDHEGRIHELVRSLGLESRVRFTGRIERQQLPNIYQEHDVLIFPSVWDEPFSITLLEAMSSGLAAIGTTTGGSAEILQDSMNALTFPKEDALVCANQILRLVDDNNLFQNIRLNGRRTVEKQFRIESMIDKIERSLQQIRAEPVFQ